MEGCGGDEPEQILAQFLTQYYDDEHLIPRNVLVQCLPEPVGELEKWLRERKGSAVSLSCPQRGDKVDLIRLAAKNAENALFHHRESQQVKFARTTLAMEELQKALNLPTLPRRIEGYDISNTQGILSVAAMVVFEDGQPAKKEYRHFRIKTVEGPNDFASMYEVLYRRLTHGLTELKERTEAGLDPAAGRFSKLPDVILIDGGPEQLAYAQRAMKDAGANIPMFSLAERFEIIFVPDQEEPIVLDRRSNAQLLIQHVRDEAHRFGITHHRSLRGKSNLHSELDNIEGIGPKRRTALIRHFGGVKPIFTASKEALMEVEGISDEIAQRILSYAKGRK